MLEEEGRRHRRGARPSRRRDDIVAGENRETNRSGIEKRWSPNRT
jgi:hypothetical protein